MNTIRLLCVAIVVGIVAVCRDAVAQTHADPASMGRASSMSENDVRDLVDTVADQIEHLYVDADTAKLIANKLRASLRSGTYRDASDPGRLADLMTKDLRSVNGDLHLSERVLSASGTGGMMVPSFLRREQHYALGRVDVLPGNIGYMELRGFAIDSAARSVMVAALEYLKSTNAIIIDVRHNPGGSGELSNFLISHFTGPDTIASLRVKSRDGVAAFAHTGNMNFVRYTMAKVPGPRRTDVPVYILTSRGTASAGEDFTFVMQNLKRATVIGDRTAGAGHNVAMMPSGHGFGTSISITRVSDPKTGKEWERVGVQPDVKVDPAVALDSAQILALRAIEAKASPNDRARLAFLREIREATMHARAVPAATLAQYAGDYEGDRRVRASNGRLLYDPRVGAMTDTLVSISDSVFAASSQARLTFAKGAEGKIELHIASPEGVETVARRKSDSASRPAG